MNKTYPPPIISTQTGSWAHSTVAVRLPAIASRVIEENDFPAEINGELLSLKEDIPTAPIRYLRDSNAPDHGDWQRYIEPYLGKDWLSIPWFFTEHYFYRRIMEAVDYFQLGVDPFGYQKIQGLEKSIDQIQSLAKFLAEGIDHPEQRDRTLREGVYFSLWGNQADLSLWPADGEGKGDPMYESSTSLRDHLLANDIQQVIKQLLPAEGKSTRVDLMLDNAGFELITDLALVDILISLGLAEEVVLHAKAHPTFVSDVIEDDLQPAVNFLLQTNDNPTIQFGQRLEKHFQDGVLKSKSDYFWNSPRMMWDLPTELETEFSRSRLLISKGDANYRRILGDREWDFTTRFPVAVDYLPVPLAALRTLKAELAVGLELAQIQDVFNQDRDWLVDGKWGVIHFSRGR